MSKIWEINEMSGKNPIHTGSFLNSYDQRSFSPEQVVARESVQNAMDAGRSFKEVTELEFHDLHVSGDKKAKLLDLFQFSDMLKSRIKPISKNDRNQHLTENLDAFLKKPELRALLIRDFNTCGLGGAWDKYEASDHFGRLVCALNLDDKADNDASFGGSFGLGKTAYAKSSSINTVIYHSTFKPTESSNDVGRRLMVSGIYPRHKISNTEYGGYAYFGVQEKGNKNSARPFEDDEAQELWTKVEELFGISSSRDDSQHGTDVLILMSALEMEEIVRAVEDYYFPAIINGEVSIKFFSDSGEVSFPKPRERNDLDQFIRLYKDAVGDRSESTETKMVESLSKLAGHQIGKIAFEVAEQHEAVSDRSNCVALMRGTGMVIDYLKIGSEKYEPAVGVFVANRDTWKYLRASENAAHSEWSEHSRRLAQDFPDIGRKIVERVNRVVRHRFNEFQKSLQPDVVSTRNESGLLAKLLAGALTGSTGDSPPPPGAPNPASVSLRQTHRDAEKSTWRLLIEPNENTPLQPFRLKLSPSISLSGDSKKVAIKHKDFIVRLSLNLPKMMKLT